MQDSCQVAAPSSHLLASAEVYFHRSIEVPVRLVYSLTVIKHPQAQNSQCQTGKLQEMYLVIFCCTSAGAGKANKSARLNFDRLLVEKSVPEQ